MAAQIDLDEMVFVPGMGDVSIGTVISKMRSDDWQNRVVSLFRRGNPSIIDVYPGADPAKQIEMQLGAGRA